MNLRPKAYSDFADILTKKVQIKSMEIKILAALNFVSGFRRLHIKGFSYQDLNDGNFFIDVNSGDVLICDNDNVTPGNTRNPGNVGGKPGYMAPEVVTGEANPGPLSDYYSLAVILFKLFINHDPLMGEKYHKSVIMGPKETLELYGQNPVFIWDPNDKSNRPKPGVDNNPIRLWPLFPKFFQDAFIKSFVEGAKNANARYPENFWQKTLIQLRDEFSTCPECQELILPWSNNIKGVCSGCGKEYAQPPRLNVGAYHVPLFPGQKLYACHTVGSSDDYATQTGEITTSKKDTSKIGLRNLSDDQWTYTGPKGETVLAGKGSVIPIRFTDAINFRKVTGKIEDGKDVLSTPLCLFVKQYQLPLVNGQQLYACHTRGMSDDETTVTGQVTTNKKDSNLLGIRNLSDDEWTFIAVTGEKKTIGKNGVIPIKKDIAGGFLVNFKGITGKIAKK
jgi:serine/threonine protein kinase